MTDTNQFPELYAYFNISSVSALDLDDITRVLRIEPTKKYVRGSRVQSPPHPRFNVWSLETARERALDAEPIIAALVDKLDSRRSGLADLRHRYPGAEFSLKLVAYIVAPDGVTPSVMFPAGLLARIADLRLDFGVSLYLTE